MSKNHKTARVREIHRQEWPDGGGHLKTIFARDKIVNTRTDVPDNDATSTAAVSVPRNKAVGRSHLLARLPAQFQVHTGPCSEYINAVRGTAAPALLRQRLVKIVHARQIQEYISTKDHDPSCAVSRTASHHKLLLEESIDKPT